MGLDLLLKFSVSTKVNAEDGKELFEVFLGEDEQILLSYKAVRDRLIFTNKKIITYNAQGLTGTKKEFRFFPYTKLSSYSVETAGVWDFDSDMKIWCSGVGCFSVKFGAKLDIHEIGALLSEKVK